MSTLPQINKQIPYCLNNNEIREGMGIVFYWQISSESEASLRYRYWSANPWNIVSFGIHLFNTLLIKILNLKTSNCQFYNPFSFFYSRGECLPRYTPPPPWQQHFSLVKVVNILNFAIIGNTACLSYGLNFSHGLIDVQSLVIKKRIWFNICHKRPNLWSDWIT